MSDERLDFFFRDYFHGEKSVAQLKLDGVIIAAIEPLVFPRRKIRGPIEALSA